MRNRLLLLAATIAFAACADDQHSTAPANARSSRANAATAGASTQTAVSPQAKPTDQVGFTTVSEVTSAPFYLAAGAGQSLTATCPAGTTVIGGTYRIVQYLAASTPPWVVYNARDAQNGWTVGLSNATLGAGVLTFTVTAYCAS